MRTALFLLFGFFLPLSWAQDAADSVLRVNSTRQSYSASQPWQKNNPARRSGLGCLLPGNKVLTTAALAANSIYLELETADRARTLTARIEAIDYEANLALLTPTAGPGFLSEMTPTDLSPPVIPGDQLSVIQLEDNGTAQRTTGTIRAVTLKSTFLANRYFLTYEMKASMQSSASSFTLPAFNNNRLAGVLTSYDNKDQLSDLIAIDIIRAFLNDAADGTYTGFPSLGVGYASTEDRNFRKWLKLPEDQGGLFIDRILDGGAAQEAGLQKGDVLLAIDQQPIDRRGYFQHPDYGTLFWVHLIGGARQSGDTVTLSILRDGKTMEIPVTLTRRPPSLIPHHLYDQAPPYLIKGGLVFQELSRPYLKAFGKDWAKRAPLNLLDILSNPSDYDDQRRKVVVLTRVVPTEATIGYDSLSNHVIESINGKIIAGIPEAIAAFEKVPENGLHKIVTDTKPFELFLDENLADRVDQQFLQSGLPGLSRSYPVP